MLSLRPCLRLRLPAPSVASPRSFIVPSRYPPVPPVAGNYVAELHRHWDRHSDRPAIIDGTSGAVLSFSDLRRATLAVGSGLLRQCSFGRGQTLVLFTHNRPEFALALHGAVAAGGAASPLNCHYTPSELEHPLRLSEASVVVTDRQRLPVVRQAMANAPSVRHVFLAGEGAAASAELGCRAFDELLADNGGALGDSPAEVDADQDLAFLPFSSGTSGLPKGVMLSHRNVTSNLLMSQALLETQVGDVAVGVLPFFHIYALNVVLGNVLHSGGSIVTMPAFEPEMFLDLMQRYRVSITHAAPPLVLFLLQHPLVQQTDLSALRRLMSGGAPMGKDVELEAIEKFGSRGVDVMQGYGLTETSPIVFICPRPHLRPKDGSTIGSVGVSPPSQECRVVDPQTRSPLGFGESGELAVRGPHVMKGYLHRPDATAECIDEDGWFYTGDIGHFDDHEFFFVTDRVKELIKFKGFQVAPAEVESVLQSHPEISDCAVVGKPDQRHGELPIAFISRASSDLTEDDIHEFLASRLAPHKQLRGGVVFVDKVPRSPSGKLLRRILRDKLKS